MTALAHGPAGQFIAACWAIAILYWIASAFSVKRTIQRQGWMWRFTVFTLIAIFLLWRYGMYFQLTADARLWPDSLAVGILADGVTAAGLLIAIWARRTLGRNWSISVVLKEKHELIRRGPYAYVRHPIYTGLLLMLAGGVIVYGTVDGLIMFALTFLGIWMKVRMEERLMTVHFPADYPAYRTKTAMLVPFIL